MMFQCTSCNKEDVLIHDPRMLDCGHLMCLKCIPKETTNGLILCPKCLGDTVVPPDGVSQLNRGPLLKQLTDLLANAEQPCSVCGDPANFKCTRWCNMVLCTKCLKQPKPSRCGHENAAPITMHCPVHKKFLISEYCSECYKLLCTRCITEGTCKNPKITIQETAKHLHCQSHVPKEDLLAKKQKLEQLRKQLSDIEKQVLKNTQEIIQLTLKTEVVILQQLKQNKQAVCEQLKSTNILLNEDFKAPLHHPVRSNGPAITLLMQRLQLQMLEASINTPRSKFAFTTGSLKPFRLTIFHENSLYDPAKLDNRFIANIDSWEVNDAYEYVSSNGERFIPPRNRNEAHKLPEITWIKNDFYIKFDTSCNCGTGCTFDTSPDISTEVNQNQTKSEITWIKNETYIKVDTSCHCGNISSYDDNKNPINGALEACSTKHQQPASPVTTPVSNKKTPPKVPPKPPNKLVLENPSGSSGFDQVDSTPTPRLHPNFVEFAENAEDYSYVDNNYKRIDWTHQPNKLKNWTKDTSQLLVTPDGQTILSYHTGSSTMICVFNDSGQQRSEPRKVNYKVLDMTYSTVHKCAVLLEKKSVHFFDVEEMSEKWKVDLPKETDKDYSLLSCATLHKGYLLVLYETKGKLKLCIAELSAIQQKAFSDITSNTQHLKPHGCLEMKTDSKGNIYLINKEKRKIVVINSKCKFRPVLMIPPCDTHTQLPTSLDSGIFLNCQGRLGYVKSKVDGTFAFYWINISEQVVHLTDNMDQIICVGHTGLHVYNKEHLFGQGAMQQAAHASATTDF